MQGVSNKRCLLTIFIIKWFWIQDSLKVDSKHIVSKQIDYIE